MTTSRSATDDLIAVAAEALGALVEFQRAATGPAEARRACRRLDARGGSVALIAQREPWTGAHHYEVVLDQPGVGAATLAFCADRGAPYLVRGAARLDDDVVARIDGVPIRVPEAIELVDLGAGSELADRLITAVVIRDAIEREGLAGAPVDDAALQQAVDDFRVAHGLYDATATERWLDHRGWTLAVLERVLEDQVRARMLRDRITGGDAGGKIDAWFAAHAADLDTVVAGVARLAGEVEARAVAERGRTEPLHAIVEELAAAGDRADYQIERWRRADCPAGLRAALFDEPAGPPRAVGDLVVRVIARQPCRALDDTTRRAVRDRLFADWLAHRRAEARVEWCPCQA